MPGMSRFVTEERIPFTEEPISWPRFNSVVGRGRGRRVVKVTLVVPFFEVVTTLTVLLGFLAASGTKGENWEVLLLF